MLEIPLGVAHLTHTTGDEETATIVPSARAVEVYFDSWLHWLGQGETLDNGESTTLQLAATRRKAASEGRGLPACRSFCNASDFPCWASSPG